MLEFGSRDPALAYRLRPAAFGICERDGLIATVRVERDAGRSYHDLPGGAVDGQETETQALVREFAEETGLIVEPGDLVLRASQLFLKSDGEPVENDGGLYLVRESGHDPALKVEDDHTLVWMDPHAAVLALRHESHAWAVARWLRRRA
ncbi:MAG TPA: NUDIX domain-containing protein [Caulobacter sp.]|nr:NUDIX domain-containing protein [Caulobacter sp.]